MTDEQAVREWLAGLLRSFGVISPEAQQALALLDAKDAEIAALKGALTDSVAHLAAAISLLERGGKAAKKAAPSDRMFDQMLTDYRNSLERTRAILTKGKTHD